MKRLALRQLRFGLEALEAREVPAVIGALDPSFDTDGVATLAGAPLSGVALQPDGKIVAVGSQGGDFLIVRYNPDGTPDTSFDADGKVTVDFLGLADAATDVAIQPDGKIVVVGAATTAGNGTDFALVRLNPDGTLDTSFDGDGKFTIGFGGGGTKNDSAEAVAVAANGDIFVVGTATNAGGTLDFGVARVSGTSGALITAFGNNGKQFLDFGGANDRGNAIAIQPDGKVVVAGVTDVVAANGNDFAVARLDPTTGALDATFNAAGPTPGQRVINFAGASNDTANDVAIQPDGKIVIAGFTNVATLFDAGVARLNPDGSLDSTLDENGLAEIDLGGALDTANRVLPLPDGKILLVGHNETGIVVARLTTTGDLDPTFDSDGKVAVDVGTGVDTAADAVLTPQGRVVIAGSSGAGGVGVLARVVTDLEDPRRVAVGGSVDGRALVYAPDPATGKLNPTAVATVSAFGALTTNVRVAVGDVNGDFVEDLVLVTGPGTPIQLAVVSGVDNTTVLVPAFDPFSGGFSGGGFVTAGDIDNDGRAEFVVTPDRGGGPRVTIFSLLPSGRTQRANFFGIADPEFRGGARAAIGDVNRDGVADLAVAAGFGGGPRVALYDGRTVIAGTPNRLLGDFFVFEDVLRNGVYLTIGDVDADGFGDLIFGAGPGGAPRLLTISGQRLLTQGAVASIATPLANFFVASNDRDRGGVRVSTADLDGDNKAEVVTGTGEGSVSRVRVYFGTNFVGSGEPSGFQDLDPFGGAIFVDGIYVG